MKQPRLTIFMQYYPSSNSHWYANHPVWNNVYLYPRDRCFEVHPDIKTWTAGKSGLHCKSMPMVQRFLARTQTDMNVDEHEVELNTLPRFFTHFSQGTLPSGARMRTTQSSLSLAESLLGQLPNPPPPAIGGIYLLQPLRRLFNAFGSRANTQHAVFTQGGLNLLKTAVST